MVTKKHQKNKRKTQNKKIMKKVLFALFAVAALASCSNNEVVELNREQIAFGDTFVNNATKADYSTGKTVDAFKVYGTVTALGNTTTIFNANNVTRGSKTYGEAWACDGTPQYWLPNASYSFAAIVDGEAVATATLPAKINHTVADGANNKDLLYATANVTTDDTATPDNVNTNNVVAFDFSHLLSKVQFNIKNETNQKYQVTGITVTGVAEDGIYSVGAATPWAKDGGDTTTLTFGTATVAGGATVAASETRQILPVAQTLAVTITYNVLDGSDAVVGTLTKTGSITETFAQNTVYVVTATLSGSQINFSLGTLGGWGAEDGTLGI